MKAIDVQNISKKYGNFTAVDHISFSIAAGEFVSFLGANGAGKSTTIRMLSTLLAPDTGSVKICGYPLHKTEEVRKQIGIVWQENVLDDLLSVHENLLCRASLHGLSKTEAQNRIEELSRQFTLGPILRKKYCLLSGGQKRKCEIAAALMHTPKILFLDEPTAGLDPGARTEVWNAIQAMRQKAKMVIFLTTHYLEEAEDADRIILIDRGRIIAQNTPHALKGQYTFCRLKLYTETPKTLLPKLQNRLCNCTDKCITVALKSTMEAISILRAVQKDITGFEVVQGSLDDIFLQTVGGERLDAIHTTCKKKHTALS